MRNCPDGVRIHYPHYRYITVTFQLHTLFFSKIVNAFGNRIPNDSSRKECAPSFNRAIESSQSGIRFLCTERKISSFETLIEMYVSFPPNKLFLNIIIPSLLHCYCLKTGSHGIYVPTANKIYLSRIPLQYLYE